MVLARRSFRGLATAARSFRAAPVARRSGQVLGRRFYSSGKGYEEHATSDLPWYVSADSFDCFLQLHGLLIYSLLGCLLLPVSPSL